MVSDGKQAGGGSGGGPGAANHSDAVDGSYTIAGNQVNLISRPPIPPALPGPSVINLLAGDMVGLEGSVNVRGSRGVRITAGPPPLPSAQSDSTNGVEVLVGEIGTLTLQRGLLPTDQSMEMTPTGVTIDGGVGKVTIKSMTQIELSVCEGVAKITIDPSGVTIDALTINLSAQVMAQLQSIMTQVSGSAMTQISGGITMIG